MSELRIDLEPALRSELEGLGVASSDELSAWIADAVREKLSASRQIHYLEARASRGSREAFDRVMAQVPAVEPEEEDRW